MGETILVTRNYLLKEVFPTGGFFALLAALCFTIDNILIRKGLMEENHGDVWEIRLVVSLTTMSVFTLILIIASFMGFNILEEFKLLAYSEVIFLVVAGLLGPLLGGILLTTAIAQIGASHTAALWGGSNPLFTTLFAVAFLGERPDLIGVFSVLIIISGIVVVGYHGYEGTVMLIEKTKLSGGLIALLSGICVSFSQIGRGAALSLGATPNTAFFIFQLTSLIVIITVCMVKKRGFSFLKCLSRKSLCCYSFAGVSLLVAAYSILVAFTLIPVWQAVAIRNIQPILAVILSGVFLRRVDRITYRLVLGSVLVTFGVIILNIYQ